MRTISDITRYTLELDQADTKREDPIPVTRSEYENLRDSMRRISRSPMDVIKNIVSMTFMGRRLEIL